MATGQAVNTIEELFGKTGKTDQTKRVVDVWVDIPQAGRILGLRTHQIRPLQWDSELGEVRKRGRKVIFRKSAVLAYKKAHPEIDQTSATSSDMAQEVLSACELVSKLFAGNVVAVGGKEFVTKVQTGLTRFMADARNLTS